jgi:hypothetical protein
LDPSTSRSAEDGPPEALAQGGHEPLPTLRGSRPAPARFLAAARDGDLQGLVAVLVPDAVLVGDLAHLGETSDLGPRPAAQRR